MSSVLQSVDLSFEPPATIDYARFQAELDQLKRDVVAEVDAARDHAHLRKLALWGRASTALGYATAWIAPNPVSAALLAIGASARWTIVMHHVAHRSMDKVPGVPERFTSRGFAMGARRWLDWLDWISPDAWRYEHNQLHHFHTGELLDPDLVENNLEAFRNAKIWIGWKYIAIAFYTLTWKLTYYAPSTFQAFRRAERLRAAKQPITAENMAPDRPYRAAFDLRDAEGRAFWKECLLPYGLARFVAAPLAFLPLGPWAAFSVLANSVMAEALTNLHTFFVIVPNHVGDDVYRFEGSPSGRADFYLRQILGSVNFRTGGDVWDFFHGFLNYQIEHHLWPELPPAACQRAAPRVKAICEAHGIPYLQESIWVRARKTLDVLVGKASMQRTASPLQRQRSPSA